MNDDCDTRELHIVIQISYKETIHCASSSSHMHGCSWCEDDSCRPVEHQFTTHAKLLTKLTGASGLHDTIQPGF